MLSFNRAQKVRISCLYVSFPNETHENKHCRPQLQTDNSAKEKELRHNLFGGHVDPSTFPDGRGSRRRHSLRSPGRREEEVGEVGLQPHRVQVTSAPRMRMRYIPVFRVVTVAAAPSERRAERGRGGRWWWGPAWRGWPPPSPSPSGATASPSSTPRTSRATSAGSGLILIAVNYRIKPMTAWRSEMMSTC